MFDMAQPQAVDTANQPEIAAAAGGELHNADRDEAFLTVRYNKEELPLSREAAAEYAQKGLNYDKLNGRLEKAQQMLTAYEGIDVLARDYAHSNGVNETQAIAAIKQRLDEEHKRQETVNMQLDVFLQAHPDIDPRMLPISVVEAWKNGTPLLDAYDRMRTQEQQREHARRINAQNTVSSMGGAIGMGSAAPRPITEDGIKMMSTAELEKNHSRIWAFLTGQKE